MPSDVHEYGRVGATSQIPSASSGAAFRRRGAAPEDHATSRDQSLPQRSSAPTRYRLHAGVRLMTRTDVAYARPGVERIVDARPWTPIGCGGFAGAVDAVPSGGLACWRAARLASAAREAERPDGRGVTSEPSRPGGYRRPSHSIRTRC